MSDLQNLTPANTYKALLQIGDYTDGISGDTGGNALQVTDGAGNNTALAISTDRVGIGTTSPTQELDVNGDIVSTTLTTSGAVTAGSVSTSGAVGAGSIDVSGNVVADEYALDQTGSSSSAVAIHAPATNELAIRTNSTEAMRIDSDGQVGIGTASPGAKLFIKGSQTEEAQITISADNSAGQKDAVLFFNAYRSSADAGSNASITTTHDNDGGKAKMLFATRQAPLTDPETAMVIDSAGKVGIGTTSPSALLTLASDVTNTDAGQIRHEATQDSTYYTQIGTRYDYNKSFVINNRGDEIITYSKGPTLGLHLDSNESDLIRMSTGGTESLRIDSSGNVLPGTDNTQPLGSGILRWDVIYVKDTNITTSDRQQKQDIEELTEAETRVAQACKGLLRKYRWKDAVAKKGDEARIHFGIIAQDLEDAFTAEGLDAGRYAMFVKNTWWTADRVIPAVEAVEAVYNEEGNEVSPAVEAQPEKTVTDIFENSEDAPEGATEVTQRGVRYSELLAFIISAI